MGVVDHVDDGLERRGRGVGVRLEPHAEADRERRDDGEKEAARPECRNRALLVLGCLVRRGWGRGSRRQRGRRDTEGEAGEVAVVRQRHLLSRGDGHHHGIEPHRLKFHLIGGRHLGCHWSV